MTQKTMSLIKLAHNVVENVVRPNDTVIDATIGNGHDTLFLAQQVGHTGHVFGFDIQPAAIDKTNALLKQYHVQHQVTLIKQGHQHISQVLERHGISEVSVVMFNLGYLPHGDKSIITKTATSFSALRQSLSLIKIGGIITLLAYPGHEGGRQETDRLSRFIQGLDPIKFEVNTSSDLRNSISPLLFIIKKHRYTTVS